MKSGNLVSMLVFSFCLVPFARAEREIGGRESNLAAIEINFSSRGDGIDGAAFTDWFNLLNQSLFNGDARKVVNTPWGREGERKVCVELSSVQVASDFALASAIIINTHEPDLELRRTSIEAKVDCKGDDTTN